MGFYLVISIIFSNFAVYLGDTQRMWAAAQQSSKIFDFAFALHHICRVLKDNNLREAATRCSWSQQGF